ncbi:MAG TPA: hypothetical protein VK524_12790, partial [Polyangiaceae bacterium]|nr:hypothetical protein [Polyangiaceae bacterium]
KLQEWLDGTRTREHAGARSPLASGIGARRSFVELTPGPLRGRLVLVKALPHHELPLCFGRTRMNGDSAYDIHPIP